MVWRIPIFQLDHNDSDPLQHKMDGYEFLQQHRIQDNQHENEVEHNAIRYSCVQFFVPAIY